VWRIRIALSITRSAMDRNPHSCLHGNRSVTIAVTAEEIPCKSQGQLRTWHELFDRCFDEFNALPLKRRRIQRDHAACQPAQFACSFGHVFGFSVCVCESWPSTFQDIMDFLILCQVALRLNGKTNCYLLELGMIYQYISRPNRRDFDPNTNLGVNALAW